MFCRVIGCMGIVAVLRELCLPPAEGLFARGLI